jgi:hypothetical protein
MADRAIFSIDAPPSDQVECVWQSPRSAARISAPSSSGITRSGGPCGDLGERRIRKEMGRLPRECP